jgi:hypothetical protein
MFGKREVPAQVEEPQKAVLLPRAAAEQFNKLGGDIAFAERMARYREMQRKSPQYRLLKAQNGADALIGRLVNTATPGTINALSELEMKMDEIKATTAELVAEKDAEVKEWKEKYKDEAFRWHP